MSVARRARIAQGKRGGGGAATLKFYICMSHKRATIFPSRCYQSARDVVAAGAEEIQRAVEKAGAWKPRHKLSLFLSLYIYIFFFLSFHALRGARDEKEVCDATATACDVYTRIHFSSPPFFVSLVKGDSFPSAPRKKRRVTTRCIRESGELSK